MRWFGTKGPVEWISSRERSSSGGFRTVRRWEGFRGDIEAIEQDLVSIGVEYRADLDAKPASIEAYYDDAQNGDPAENQIESSWNLLPENNQKSLWEHPKVYSTLITWDILAVCLFRKAFEDSLNTGLVDKTLEAIFTTYPDLKEFHTAMALNRTTFSQPGYVVRHTVVFPRSVPPSIKYVFDFDSVNKSVESNTLQALEPTIPFTLPSNITFLAQAPSVQQRTDGKLEVVREWAQIDKDTWIYESL